MDMRMSRSSCSPSVILILSALALASTASAQTNYIGVTGFADIRQFGTSNGCCFAGYGDVSLDATGAGGGLRIGTYLHPRWSLELGVDVATKETVDIEDQVRILIFPPPRVRDLKASTSFVDVTTLVGFHPPSIGRVKLGYRVGFSFVHATYKSDYPGYYPQPLAVFTDSRITNVPSPITLPSPTVIVPPISSLTQKQNTGALAFGFDAAINLTTHLAVAPELRAMVFSTPSIGPGVFLIRPGVGVRWNF
jgi:hypothetical protein